MSRDKWLTVKLSEEEAILLKKYAAQRGWNVSQLIREWVRNSPPLTPP
jgi:predicted DNA binding CopG/RHH family protein